MLAVSDDLHQACAVRAQFVHNEVCAPAKVLASILLPRDWGTPLSCLLRSPFHRHRPERHHDV
ncbi:MAG: hypothetical protein EBW55_08990 [Betaproteobacteria bacterium]|nr:hypothetical protein [Betaproteobacteria bacterium]NCW98386.1 hypothetical protein [Betaproteobacteria bacterium]NCX72371.1 hypothetical protein [Betaproteobacteria bacterium]NDG35569.1 hypothetical protein [Betaproteobacteria bacterium]